MNNSSWNDLICDFFYKCCLESLGEYFTKNGFSHKRNKIDGVIFQKGNIFVEISYNPETYPNYQVNVVIGFGSGAYDAYGKFSGLPIWFLFSEENDDSMILRNIFTNKEELRDILADLKLNILGMYIKPLWDDGSKLQNELARFDKMKLT